MNFPLNVRGFVKLISKEPMEVEPETVTVGGFGANGVIFDWVESRLTMLPEKDGRLSIEGALGEFDVSHYHSSNETTEAPDWETILKGVIDEVHYEAFSTDPTTGEETHYQFELDELHIGDWIDDDFLMWHNFSREQVNAYNEERNALARG